MIFQFKSSLDSLSREQLEAARAIARTLRAAGHEAWLVGGCVRDLFMGRIPHDLDIATDASPDRVESLFDHTLDVGREFGTMIVVHRVEEGSGAEAVDAGRLEADSRTSGRTDGERTHGNELRERRPAHVAIEVTTFRSEGEYSDSRRPDEVSYVSSAEIDASRRDFTCNALYLDPLEGRCFDPCGGVPDIEARVLRAVGEAGERFREDGLRLIRMARFEARLDFSPAEGLHEVARAARTSLVGVSVERVHDELRKIFGGPRAARAIAVLAECELLKICLPAGWGELSGGSVGERIARLEALSRPFDETRDARSTGAAIGARDPAPIGLERGLATLFGPAPGAGETERARAADALAELRPSRATRRDVVALWEGEDALASILENESRRCARVRLVRRADWPSIVALHAARLEAEGDAAERLAALHELARWADSLTEEERAPAPLVTSRDLAELGVPRGAAWGLCLREGEDAQLDGAFDDHAGALEWLRKYVAELR